MPGDADDTEKIKRVSENAMTSCTGTTRSNNTSIWQASKYDWRPPLCAAPAMNRNLNWRRRADGKNIYMTEIEMETTSKAMPSVPDQATIGQPMRFLRLEEVLAISGKSRSSIYEAIKMGKFPKPVKLGANSSAWINSEIDEWMRNCIETSRQKRRSPEAAHRGRAQKSAQACMSNTRLSSRSPRR